MSFSRLVVCVLTAVCSFAAVDVSAGEPSAAGGSANVETAELFRKVTAADLASGAWWLQRAREDTQRISDVEDRVRALCMIAEGQIDLNDPPAVRQTLDLAQELAVAIDDERSRDRRYADLAQLWARIGDSDKALDVVERISDDSMAASVRRGIAESPDDMTEIEEQSADPLQQIRGLINRGGNRGRGPRTGTGDGGRGVEQAASVAETITDPIVQAWAMRMVAEAWAESGKSDLAWTVATNIADPTARCAAYLALWRAGAEDDDWPRRCLSAAGEAAAGIADAAERIGAAIRLASAQLTSEQMDLSKSMIALALESADELSGRGRIQALGAIVSLQIAAEDLDGAGDTARRIGDPFDRAWALCTLTRGQIAASDMSAAANALGMARQAASEIEQSNSFWKAFVLAQIATVEAEAHQLMQADKTVETIASADAQGVARYQMAMALAASGQADEAQAMASQIDDPFWRVWVYPDAAAALVESENPVGARVMLQHIHDPLVKRELEQATVMARVRSGELDPVQVLAENPDDDAATLEVVAEMQAAAGQIQAASETIARITDRRQRGRTSWHIVQRLLEADDLDGARVIAEGIDSRWRRWILADIAAAYARKHDMQALLQWCESVPEPENRAMIRVGAARGLHDASQ